MKRRKIGEVGKRLLSSAMAMLLAFSCGGTVTAFAKTTTTETSEITAGVSSIVNEGGSNSNDDVTVSKYAAATDEDDVYDITLSVEGAQEVDNVAVMFLLDKSTSTDVTAAADAMLEELATKTNTNILVNVVTFSETAQSTGWVGISDGIVTDAVKADTASGTDMTAGIALAEYYLSSIKKEGYETYLITLSDGITYLWTDYVATSENVVANGSYQTLDVTVYTVPIGVTGSKTAADWTSEVTTTIHDGTSAWDAAYSTTDETGTLTYRCKTFSELYGSFNGFLNAMEEKKVDNSYFTDSFDVVQEYGSSYSNYLVLRNSDSGEDYADWNATNVTNTYALGPEIAAYMAYERYYDLVYGTGTVDHAYAFALPEYNSDGTEKTTNWILYGWGEELMEALAGLNTDSTLTHMTTTTAADIFEDISDQIMYAINSGTVTDTMGEGIEIVAADSYAVTVTEADGTSTSYELAKQDDGTYTDGTYTVKIDGNILTWSINTPVVQGSTVSLTYTAKLVEKADVAGTYTVNTNSGATLKYTSTDGSSDSIDFPSPAISYDVTEIITTTTTTTPDETTPAAASTESIPATGDATNTTLPIAMVVCGIAILGVALTLKKRTNR